MRLKALLCTLAFIGFALPVYSQSKNGQLTILTSTLLDNAETDLEFMSKASICKWIAGPSSLDPKKLDRELLSFVGVSPEETKRICQGRISCDVGEVLLKSPPDTLCAMKVDNCDAYQCFKKYLEDRVALNKAFAKEEALKRKRQNEKDDTPVLSSEEKPGKGRK